MRTFLRQNSLSLFFAVIFLAALVGQGLAGHADYNAQQISDGLATVSLARYLTSSSFVVDVAENWQSEYLQFLLYIYATVWFLQRGSPESKSLDQAGTETDEKQKVGRFADDSSPAAARAGGLVTALYSRSLVLVMGAIFLASWALEFLAGRIAYNEEQLAQLQAPASWTQYLLAPDFWNRTVQNWQSEFLAVGSMAVLSIYLRQRGSPESKPVGAAHTSTGVEG
jgi:uncharacterized protein DUF6766